MVCRGLTPFSEEVFVVWDYGTVTLAGVVVFGMVLTAWVWLEELADRK